MCFTKGDAMSVQMCERCGKEEYIPTYQFVKFDLKVNYVCKDCWEEFRAWMLMKKVEEKRFIGGAVPTAAFANVRYVIPYSQSRSYSQSRP